MVSNLPGKIFAATELSVLSVDIVPSRVHLDDVREKEASDTMFSGWHFEI